MKRQKKFKAVKLPNIMAFLGESLGRKALIFVVAVIFLLTAASLINAFLCRSDYFRLKAVDVKCAPANREISSAIAADLLAPYRNRNIFAIDLKAIARQVRASYPDAKDVIVTLALPDKIVASFSLRAPVAVIRNSKMYPVDEDGFLTSGALAQNTALPAIEGINVLPWDRRNGVVISDNLKIALALVKEINKNRAVRQWGLETVDAGDLDNLSFYLANGVQVVIGRENFRERLGMLAHTLKDPRLAMDKIRYIDVRFKDVVIGPK